LTALAITQSLLPVLASKLTEVIYVPLPESSSTLLSRESYNILHQQFSQYDVLLMGCGLGQARETVGLVQSILFDSSVKHPSVVLDADGINALAANPEWCSKFTEEAILTPHTGENGQADREIHC
jgi:NAD(P)H-hydrate epimerase